MILARLAPDNPEPWGCDYCGEMITPLNNEEMWHYVRTGEGATSKPGYVDCTVKRKGVHGKRKAKAARG